MTMTMTNPYTSHLEALDRKAGRVHTIDDWRRVGETSQYTPEVLTDDDLVILAYFDGEASMDRARARRAKALAPPPPPDPPVTKTTSATPSRRDRYPRKEESWADYVKRCPDAPVPLALFDGVRTFVQEMNTKNVERNQRLDTLEARVMQLEAKPHLKFRGVWEQGKSYSIGDCSTHHGSLWVCKAATTGKPGEDFVGWVLAVKQGHAR